MTSNNSHQASKRFALRPVIFGIAVVLLGIAAVVVSQMLGVPAEWFRIGGLALCLVGSLAVGFGLLLRAANKAAHADGSGPSA